MYWNRFENANVNRFTFQNISNTKLPPQLYWLFFFYMVQYNATVLLTNIFTSYIHHKNWGKAEYYQFYFILASSSRAPLSAITSNVNHTPSSQRDHLDNISSKRCRLALQPAINLFNRFKDTATQHTNNFSVSHLENIKTPLDTIDYSTSLKKKEVNLLCINHFAIEFQSLRQKLVAIFLLSENYLINCWVKITSQVAESISLRNS